MLHLLRRRATFNTLIRRCPVRHNGRKAIISSSVIQSMSHNNLPSSGFCSSSSTPPSETTSLINEAQFHSVADTILEEVQDMLDVIEESSTQSDITPIEMDVTLSQGVLNASFANIGTWVLNKQTPNRQIWWSSPLSGPRRFEYNGESWTSTRDSEVELLQLLREEMEEITGVSIM